MSYLIDSYPECLALPSVHHLPPLVLDVMPSSVNLLSYQAKTLHPNKHCSLVQTLPTLLPSFTRVTHCQIIPLSLGQATFPALVPYDSLTHTHTHTHTHTPGLESSPFSLIDHQNPPQFLIQLNKIIQPKAYPSLYPASSVNLSIHPGPYEPISLGLLPHCLNLSFSTGHWLLWVVTYMFSHVSLVPTATL